MYYRVCTYVLITTTNNFLSTTTEERDVVNNSHSQDICYRTRIVNTRGRHLGSIRTSPFVPRTSVFVRVFQTLEVTFFGSTRTSPFVPILFRAHLKTSSEEQVSYPKDIRFRARIFDQVCEKKTEQQSPIPRTPVRFFHCKYFKHSR